MKKRRKEGKKEEKYGNATCGWVRKGGGRGGGGERRRKNINETLWEEEKLRQTS